MQHEGRMPLRIHDRILRVHLRRAARGAGAAVSNHLHAAFGRLRLFADEIRVVVGGVQERRAARRQAGHRLALRARNVLAAAQQLDMARAHVRDQRHVRLHEFAQAVQLMATAHTHLHNHGLRVRGRVQQRAGNAQLVVLVRPRRHHGELACQHIAHQILRGGLAAGARERNDGTRQMRAPAARQVCDGAVGVLHEDEGAARLLDGPDGLVRKRMGNERGRGTGLECGGHKVVAVHPFAGKSRVQVARGDLARIPRNALDRGIQAAVGHDYTAINSLLNLFDVQMHEIS